MLPVVGIRPLEGRTGTTLLVQLLGTAPDVLLDRRYPEGERRYLSYCVRAGEWLTGERTLGVTELFLGDEFGPLPFDPEGFTRDDLWRTWTAALWAATSERLGEGRWYAEKLSVPVEPILDAGIPLRVIDVVRDPRDLVVSIRSFVAKTGHDGFGRRAGESERAFVERFAAERAAHLDTVDGSPPSLDRRQVRYEDLVQDLDAIAADLGSWLGVSLDPARLPGWSSMGHHTTSGSAAASIGRWRTELADDEAELLRPLAERLGY